MIKISLVLLFHVIKKIILEKKRRKKRKNRNMREHIYNIKNDKTKIVLSTGIKVYLLVDFLLPVDRFGRRLFERDIFDQGKENSLGVKLGIGAPNAAIGNWGST